MATVQLIAFKVDEMSPETYDVVTGLVPCIEEDGILLVPASLKGFLPSETTLKVPFKLVELRF